MNATRSGGLARPDERTGRDAALRPRRAQAAPSTQCDESTGEVTTFAYDAGGDLVHAANAAARVHPGARPAGPLAGRDGQRPRRRRTPTTRPATAPAAPHPPASPPPGHTTRQAAPPPSPPPATPSLHPRRGRPRDPARTRRDLSAAFTQRWDAAGRLTAQTLHLTGPGPPPAPQLHLPPRRLRHRDPRTHHRHPPLRPRPRRPRHRRPGPRLDRDLRLRHAPATRPTPKHRTTRHPANANTTAPSSAARAAPPTNTTPPAA